MSKRLRDRSGIYRGHDVPYSSVAPIGGNDVASTYHIAVNAMPNYSELAYNSNRPTGESAYPPVKEGKGPRMAAHKNFLAFTVRDPHKWSDPALEAQAAPQVKEIDTAFFLDQLNGMFTKAQRDRLWEVTENISVLGFVESDIRYDVGRPVGAPRDTNIWMRGKKTVVNNGYSHIAAGDRCFWHLPEIDEDNNVLTGGTARIPGITEGVIPLLISPYDPNVHRASPKLIADALVASPDAALPHHTKIDSGGLKNYSVMLAEALKDFGLVFLAMAFGDDPDRIPQEAFDRVVRDPEFAKKFALKMFDLKNQSRYGNFNEPYKNRPFSATEERRQAFVPRSRASICGEAQRQGGEKLFTAMDQINEFYLSRIIGRAITSASPAHEFDILIANK
jgi:hypothetical protein